MDKKIFPYQSVLIVCSVNTARSPMAEAYFKEFFKNLGIKVHVRSCGVASNARDNMLISLDAKLAMKEEGIILSEEAKSIDLKKHKEMLQHFELILTLTEKHKKQIVLLDGTLDCEILTLKEFAGKKGDIKDPSMKGLKGFRKARNEIKTCIIMGLKRWFPDLQ
ncbi:MAG: Low molecular weight protein-tyrosine-phosphatase YwlE [Promethearchaeota archaeon]|nr:MAG: Low molecular weight protein-tyrosine-phosphatase YwlE [Candidatus Lokiarchaeota archaeon]